MPFPFTSVLDDFDRADSAVTIGGNWTLFGRAVWDMGIISRQAYNPDSEWNFLYYDAAQYGPDCEVYITLATLQPQAVTFILYARFKDMAVGAFAYDGYAFKAYRFNDGGTDTMRLTIARVDNAAETQLGATVDITDHGNGDKLGGSATGPALELWYDDGAGWESRMVRSDSTYAAAGWLGFGEGDENTCRWDDFGGGTTGEIKAHILWRDVYKSQDD